MTSFQLCSYTKIFTQGLWVRLRAEYLCAGHKSCQTQYKGYPDKLRLSCMALRPCSWKRAAAKLSETKVRCISFTCPVIVTERITHESFMITNAIMHAKVWLASSPHCLHWEGETLLDSHFLLGVVPASVSFFGSLSEGSMFRTARCTAEAGTAFTRGAYSLGKVVWGKGWEELLKLLDYCKNMDAPCPEVAIDCFGDGEARQTVSLGSFPSPLSYLTTPERDPEQLSPNQIQYILSHMHHTYQHRKSGQSAVKPLISCR